MRTWVEMGYYNTVKNHIVIEEVRTIFENKNGTTIYIPSFTLNTTGPCALG
jgi:hypothetical protein